MKINRLLQAWPNGTVATSAFFSTQGVSRKLAEQYRKGGWIDSVGVGAFVRRADKVAWPGAMYALQRHEGKPVHPGGRTALELVGAAHYLRLGHSTVELFGPPSLRLPRWLLQHDWQVRLRYVGTSSLPPDIGLATHAFGDFALSVSAPERALLEALEGVPSEVAFEEAERLMEGLPTLRPRLMQSLLEVCTSVKVKRLCLYLADVTHMPWRAALDDARIDLGTGKRQVIKRGRLDRRYGITVPRESGA